jgi:type I restriction enzyme S subunit
MVKGMKHTEIGKIPDDWEAVNIAGNSTLKARIGWQGLTTAEYLLQGNYFLVTGTDFKDGRINWDTCFYVSEHRYKEDKNIQIQNEDILITKDGTIGKVAYIENVKGPATLNSGVFVIRPKDNSYIPKFLFYVFRSFYFKTFLQRLSAGSTINHLYQKDFVDFNFPLPKEKKEQKAIGQALSDTDALISSLEKLIAKKKAIRTGSIQQLLNPERNWIEYNLRKDATLKARIGWQGLTKSEYKNTGDFYLVTGTEFSSGNIDWENCVYVEESRYSQDKNIQLKINDVLVTKDGTIGKVALIRELKKPTTLNSGVFVIRPVNNSFDPKFFFYILSSNIFKDFLDQLSAGSTINHLYQKDFMTFKFFAPKEIKEQKRIAQILSDMDEEVLALEVKLKKQKQLKKGMMQMLLTGKIRLI